MNEKIRALMKLLPHPGHWHVIDQMHTPTGLRVFGIGWKKDDEGDWVMVIESGDHQVAQAIVDIVNELAEEVVR
jgi:hypothetical protein